MPHLAKFLAVFVSLAAAAQVTPEAEKDRRLLEGHWEVVSMLNGGKEIPGLKDGKMIFVFQGDKFSVKIANKVVNEGTYTIDPTRTPKTIDLKDSRDTIFGIYELKQDQGKLCMGGRGRKDRPTDFTAKPGTDQSLVTIKRIKM